MVFEKQEFTGVQRKLEQKLTFYQSSKYFGACVTRMLSCRVSRRVVLVLQEVKEDVIHFEPYFRAKNFGGQHSLLHRVCDRIR